MGQTKPKTKEYEVNLEGTIVTWGAETITVTEIRQLAGWSSDQPVVEVDLKDNSEVTLAENAAIELKPGHGFGKKVRFQRG